MRSLDAPYKALWIYLLCECDHAGIWVVELDVAQMRLGMKLDPDKVLDKMGGAVIPIDGGKWYLPDFVEFQYGTLNPANRVHASVLERLAKCGIDPDNRPEIKPLASPLQGAKDKDKDKEKEKDKDFTQGRKERASEKTPFDSWWSVYRKGSRKLSAEQWDRMSEPDRLACIAATPAYLNSKPDPTFRKDGERFLKHRAWEDPIVEPTTMNGNGNGHAQTWGGHDAAYWDRFRAEFQATHGRGPSSGDPKELVPPGYKEYRGWT